MKKSNFILFGIVALLAVACGPNSPKQPAAEQPAAEQGYTISGSILKHPLANFVDSVYLATDNGPSAKSAVVDGKFSIAGTTAKPVLVSIVFTYNGAMSGEFSLPVVLEAGNITFLGLPSKRFAGTPLNDSIVALNQRANEVNSEVLDAKYYESLADILRTYIKNNPNDASTVYALREGINSNLFTEDEVWELLQACGDEVNTTVFAKEICAKFDSID